MSAQYVLCGHMSVQYALSGPDSCDDFLILLGKLMSWLIPEACSI